MLEVEEQIRRHATWLRTQMPPLDPPREHAGPAPRDGAPAAEQPRPDDVDEYPVVAATRQRPRRRAWATVAAAAAIIAVVVATAAVVSSSTTSRPRSVRVAAPTTAPATGATAPDSALQPTWLPDGMQVWSVAAAPAPPDKVGLVTTFTYATGVDAPSQLSISTCPGGSAGCTQSYSTARASGGNENPDGSITVADPQTFSAGGTVAHGPVVVLQRVWPDGAGVSVTSQYAPLDIPEANHIAGSIELTDQGGLAALRAALSARLQALPRLAAAALPDGRVEVHGAGAVTAVCVATGASPVVCPSARFVPAGKPAPTGGFNASLLVEGHWVVGAATPDPGTITFTPPSAGGDVGHLPPPLDGHAVSVTAGHRTYQLGLIVVPDDLSSLYVVVTTSAGSYGGAGVDRPAS
jgi:hypothetical protein